MTGDNWFTFVAVLRNLLDNDKLTCFGTVRRNKKVLPKECNETKHKAIASSIFGFKDKMTVLSYVPQKEMEKCDSDLYFS